VAQDRQAHETFPLIARRRLAGLPFGTLNSVRRGAGSDVASSRPYARGDDVGTVDWRASGKLSSARGSDEWIVRERFAEEAPRAVVVCDRRPAMGLYGPPFPWLDKPAVMALATEMIAQSVVGARGMVGYVDLATGAHGGSPFWIPPTSGSELWQIEDRVGKEASFDAPGEGPERALGMLSELRRDLPAGTFVFVLSDFLAGPSVAAWIDAMAFGWDIVPVVIQDATWEQSFPPLPSLVVPLQDPASGRVTLVRVSKREALARRGANETRRASLLRDFDALGLEPVLLGDAEEESVLRAFIEWAELRSETREVAWW
jgi:uncharacterized protein (DUF58 family)